MTNIADRFAQIEAEYKAIEKLYKAAKAEALAACMDVCGVDETESTLDGDLFSLKFKLTPVKTFSIDRAKELGFITEEEIEQCKVQGTRQLLKAEAKAKRVFA